MKLFVGLGNPGPKYMGNRHNVGFMALDQIAADHGFGQWRSKFQGGIASGRLGNGRVMLLKPETFVNRSGQSVGEVARYYRLEGDQILVFHDEIDLVPGKVRVKLGGGHAGHNGLRSIEQHIGSDFWRVRVGVGHPGRKELVPHYVLRDFAAQERDWLEDLLAAIGKGSPELARGDKSAFLNLVGQAMSRHRESPPEPSGAPIPVSKSGKNGENRSESVFRKLAQLFR